MVHLQSVQVFMYMHKMILLLFWQTEKKNPKKTLELIQATALDKKENEDAKKKNMEKELIQSGLGPAFLGFAFCAKGEDIPLIPF